jgi:hypothetical protein
VSENNINYIFKHHIIAQVLGFSNTKKKKLKTEKEEGQGN